MSSNDEAAAPAIAGSVNAVFTAMAQMDALLATLSHKERVQALGMLSAKYGQRVISMERPIVAPRATIVAQNTTQSAGPRGPKSQPKAGFRSNSRWTEAEKVHSALVSALKTSPPANKQDSLIALRNHEEGMKQLRGELADFGRGG
jgi:hypothetical protein